MVKYFYYCIDSRKCQIWWLGWLILGKTALNYSIVTIYLGLCPRMMTRVPLFPFPFGKRSNDIRELGVCEPTSRPMTLPLLAQGAVTVCTTTLKCTKPNFYGPDGRSCNSQPDFHLLNVHRE